MLLRRPHLLLIACAYNLFLAQAAKTWELWLYKAPPDENFYNLQHWVLQIMPRGSKIGGFNIEAQLNNDGETYSRRIKVNRSLFTANEPGEELLELAKGINGKDKDKLLQFARSQELPNPRANPHQNCQDFIDKILRNFPEIVLPGFLPAVQNDLKPRYPRYFLHTNNFSTPGSTKEWLYTSEKKPTDSTSSPRRSIDPSLVLPRKAPYYVEGIPSMTPVKPGTTLPKKVITRPKQPTENRTPEVPSNLKTHRVRSRHFRETEHAPSS